MSKEIEKFNEFAENLCIGEVGHENPRNVYLKSIEGIDELRQFHLQALKQAREEALKEAELEAEREFWSVQDESEEQKICNDTVRAIVKRIQALAVLNLIENKQ